MNFKKISIGVFVLLSFASCTQKTSDTPTVSAQKHPTLVIKTQDAELQTSYPVLIKGQEDIEIRPRIDGFIKEIYIDEGSLTKKGQALFKIDSPVAEQSLLTAQAAIKSAQAAVRTAELNVEKTRPLAEKGIVSDYQLKIAENNHETAKAGLAQAQAALTNAEATKSWTTVTSPVDGVVGSLNYRLGSLVNANHVLTTIANTSDIYAYFSLNEKDLLEFLRDIPGDSQTEKIKHLPQLSLILADGSVFPEKGRIETITGVVNAQTGSVNFRAKFPNKQGTLRSGSSGNVSIPTAKNNVFVIPQKATFSQQNKVLVYKVQMADSTVVQTVISVIPNDQNFIVTDGLQADDRIVSDGIASLKHAQKISL